VCPTQLPGASEPSPKTSLPSPIAAVALAYPDPTSTVEHFAQDLESRIKPWRRVMEFIISGGGPMVLPRLDHGRVGFFLEFWGECKEEELPEWFRNVHRELSRYKWK